MRELFLFDVFKCNLILTNKSHAGFDCGIDICVAFPQRAHIDFFYPNIVEKD